MRQDAPRSLMHWETRATDTPHADVSGLSTMIARAVAAWETRRGLELSETKLNNKELIERRKAVREKRAAEWQKQLKSGKPLQTENNFLRSKRLTQERRRKIANGELTGAKLAMALRKEAELKGGAALRKHIEEQAQKAKERHRIYNKERARKLRENGLKTALLKKPEEQTFSDKVRINWAKKLKHI